MTITEALNELENCIQPYRMRLSYPGRVVDCSNLAEDEILPLTVAELRRDDWTLALKG